jgi:hypothetical protein
MAYTTISMTNGVEVKKAPVGFSWTTFFFGGWPALFRQDWMWGICLLIGGLLTYGIAGMIVAFFYNKSYITRLFRQGYYVHALPANMSEDDLKNYLGFITIPSAPAAKQ